MDLSIAAQDPFERANQRYEQAVFAGDADVLEIAERELDAVEAALALARGRILHAGFLAGGQEDSRELPLFEQAADLFQRLGDERGEAEARFWIGAVHQVIRHDEDAAIPELERSCALATAAGDKLTMSYAIRHLGFADLAAGRIDAARQRLEDSVRLRREIGFIPGVAAGVLALAELAAHDGDRAQALSLLDEAAAIAAGTGAHGVLRWIEQARADL